MKKILTLILLFVCTKIASAEVTQFVFTTPPQNISVSTNSSTITVQSQNSSGVAEDITETFDITFNSTSSTGQFLSTSGNPVSTTMSKNTANKNFLYSDVSSGTHTLTVTAKARTGGQTFSANQSITVGNSSGNNQISTTTPPIINTETTTETTSTNITSAHSSPVSISNSELKMEFEISAGRDRLTTVGNTLVFKATPTKSQNISESGVIYKWSFGDGTTAFGKEVSHSYRFSGEYSVVVNASYADKQAVSRTEVKVVSPSLLLTKVSGGVEVTNKSSMEINLEGWSLVGGKKTFVFPSDTLISHNKKVIFADEVTGIALGKVELLNPLGKSFGVTSEDQVVKTDLNEITVKINEVQNEIAKISTTATKPIQRSLLMETKKATSTPMTDIVSDNVATIFVAPAQKSIVSTIFSWPIMGFNFIRNLFLEH